VSVRVALACVCGVVGCQQGSAPIGPGSASPPDPPQPTIVVAAPRGSAATPFAIIEIDARGKLSLGGKPIADVAELTARVATHGEPTWIDEPGRLAVARAEPVDRAAPLIAAVPDAPAIAIVHAVAAIGGDIVLRVDGDLGVPRVGFRFAAGHNDDPMMATSEPRPRPIDTQWDEVVVTARGIDVVSFHDKRVRPIEWSDRAAVIAALSPPPAELDVLVGSGVTAQQLVELLGLLATRAPNLGIAPAPDGTSRLQQLLANRHAILVAHRIGPISGSVGGRPAEDAVPVVQVVESARARLEACYDASPTKPEYTVGFEFFVDDTGHAQRYFFPGAHRDDIEACMEPVLTGLHYPSMKGQASVSFPLTSPDIH
jgi:hypothetical protein